jgi:hypothetical protein
MPLGEDFAAGNTVVMVVEGRISRAVHIWQTDFTSTPPLTTRRAVAESLIAKGVEELTNSGDVAESTALVRTGAQRASPSPLFLRQRRRCHLLASRCRAGLALGSSLPTLLAADLGTSLPTSHARRPRSRRSPPFAVPVNDPHRAALANHANARALLCVTTIAGPPHEQLLEEFGGGGQRNPAVGMSLFTLVRDVAKASWILLQIGVVTNVHIPFNE